MGFISNCYDLQALATALRRERGQGALRVSAPGAREAVEALDPYIYDKLFIPIIRNGEIPIRGLDIYRVTDTELAKLSDALTKSEIPTYVKCGLIFKSLHPAASDKQIFI
jgi:hypothetical protein